MKVLNYKVDDSTPQMDTMLFSKEDIANRKKFEYDVVKAQDKCNEESKASRLNPVDLRDGGCLIQAADLCCKDVKVEVQDCSAISADLKASATFDDKAEEIYDTDDYESGEVSTEKESEVDDSYIER